MRPDTQEDHSVLAELNEIRTDLREILAQVDQHGEQLEAIDGQLSELVTRFSWPEPGDQ